MHAAVPRIRKPVAVAAALALGALALVAVLLVIRVAQRVIFAMEIEQNFGISTVRIWGQAAYFLAIAVALLLLMPRRKAQ